MRVCASQCLEERCGYCTSPHYQTIRWAGHRASGAPSRASGGPLQSLWGAPPEHGPLFRDPEQALPHRPDPQGRGSGAHRARSSPEALQIIPLLKSPVCLSRHFQSHTQRTAAPLHVADRTGSEHPCKRSRPFAWVSPDACCGQSIYKALHACCMMHISYIGSHGTVDSKQEAGNRKQTNTKDNN